MPTVIEVLVFSGLPNPTFTLDDAQQQALVNLIRSNLATNPVPAQLAVRLGYRGFEWEPPPPLGLAQLLVVGQGLVVGETNGIRTAWVDANGVEEFLKERARAANLGALVDPDRGEPVPPEVIRPEGRRMGLVDELIAGGLDFARTLLAELNSVALLSVSAFAHAAGKDGFVDNGSVAAQLTIARTQLALVGPRMATGDFAGAATLVATVLAAVDAAASLVGGLPLRDLLIANLHWSGIVPTGLAQQLGLSTVSGPRILELTDGAILFEIGAPSMSLAPAPLALGFDAASLTARLRVDGKLPAFSITLAVTGIEVGVGGGPISGLLGGARGSVQADVVVGVDTTNGLTLSGGAAKRVVLPARPKLGPLDIREINLQILSDRPGAIAIGSTLTVKLGGIITATVEGAGIGIRIDPNAATSGSNPLAVDLMAPTGIGLSLDTGLVRGGGFLGERSAGYGGALQLRLGPIEVQAVGLLTLNPSFALVVVMSVEFATPIDLSFGFTLNAVGGVVGVSHRLDDAALRDQLSSGALDHILFPADPVAAAPTILHTLEQVFPFAPGAFVIGPMIELGWGRPVSYLTAKIGVILSLPDPKIAIIGTVRIALPAPQLPIVDLRAALLGVIDTDRMYIRVSLAGSRIAGFPVTGDIGFLLRWAGGAEIAISAGGFHPRYTPPRELAGMARMGLDISPPAILRLRSETYFAVTSNSVQLGSRVEMSADLGVASIEGHFAFDALIVFSPHFMFVIDLAIGISVRAFGTQLCGVNVQLHVEGPSPWRAEGHAEVDILLWTVAVDVGPYTWGDDVNPPPALADPRQIARDALHRNPGAWQALVPPDADRIVRLAAAPPSQTDVTVHPMGLFDVRQHAIPLETVLSRVGANPVPDGQRRVHLGVPLVNATPAGALSEVTDLFASGNFLDLKDDEKMSRPGFEPMSAGARIRPPGEKAEFAASRHAELRYYTFICDDEAMRGIHGSALRDTLFASSVHTVLASGAAGASQLRAAVRYATVPDPIVLADPGAVVSVSKVTVAAVAGSEVQTYTHAAERSLGTDVQLARLGVAV